MYGARIGYLLGCSDVSDFHLAVGGLTFGFAARCYRQSVRIP